MRGRELVYIGRTTRKTKGRFDLNKRPSNKCHVSFTINDLRPTCQGYKRSSKGWVDLSSHDSLKDWIESSPHGSFHLMITDPWSEKATEEGENLRWWIYLDGPGDTNKSCQIWTDHVWTNIRWTDSSRRMDYLNKPIVDGSLVDKPRVDGRRVDEPKSHVALNMWSPRNPKWK